MNQHDEQWLDLQCLKLIELKYLGPIGKEKCEMAVELANTLRQARKDSNARTGATSGTISPIKVING